MEIEIVTYVLPAYWASYLINNDSSGMEDSEISAANKFLEQKK